MVASHNIVGGLIATAHGWLTLRSHLRPCSNTSTRPHHRKNKKRNKPLEFHKPDLIRTLLGILNTRDERPDSNPTGRVISGKHL